MKRLLSSRRAKLAVTVVAIAALSGCASVSLEQNVSRVNAETESFTGAFALVWPAGPFDLALPHGHRRAPHRAGAVASFC